MIKTFLIFFLFALTLNAQWIGGAGYQSKSSIPGKGVGFYVINKLPYQFPKVGFNLKAKLNYFYSRETYLLYSSETTDGFQEYSGDIFLETNFFFGLFNPFVELGIGGGHVFGEGYNRSFFSLSSGLGVKFLYEVQPFLELHIRRAIPGVDTISELKIKNLQAAGVIGILFNF